MKLSLTKSLATLAGVTGLSVLLAACGTPVTPQPAVASRVKNGSGLTSGGNCKPTTKLTAADTLNLADATVGGYADTIKPILDKHCVFCHRAQGTPPDLSSYAAASTVTTRDLSLKTILDESMPTGPKKLTADEKAKFKAWVDAGAPETAKPAAAAPSTPGTGSGTTGCSADGTPNGGTPKPTQTTPKPGPTPAPGTPAPKPTPTPQPPTQLAVTYDNKIAGYLNAYCTNCHGGSRPKLETFAQAKASAAASLASMKSGRMPIGQRASAADIAAFESWVNAGAPEK